MLAVDSAARRRLHQAMDSARTSVVDMPVPDVGVVDHNKHVAYALVTKLMLTYGCSACCRGRS